MILHLIFTLPTKGVLNQVFLNSVFPKQACLSVGNKTISLPMRITQNYWSWQQNMSFGLQSLYLLRDKGNNCEMKVFLFVWFCYSYKDRKQDHGHFQ